MTDERAVLAFDGCLSGNRIQLNDGTVWRVAPDSISVVRNWHTNEAVELVEKLDAAFWRFKVVNTRDGTSVNVVGSASSATMSGMFVLR